MKRLYNILNYKNIKIYQDDEWFCFSLDSVILANFPSIRMRTKRIIDLGTGNGIVPIILSQRTNVHIDAIEIQEDLAELALKNVSYNSLDKQISVYNCDIKDYAFDSNNFDKYDLVLSNPPYFKNTPNKSINFDIHKAIARHEMKITLSDLINSSWNLLKEGGIFATVNRVDRFMEIINLFAKNRFEVKYLRFIYDDIEKQPALFYIEGVKLGKSGLKVDKPFILKNVDGTFSNEYIRLQNEVMK